MTADTRPPEARRRRWPRILLATLGAIAIIAVSGYFALRGQDHAVGLEGSNSTPGPVLAGSTRAPQPLRVLIIGGSSGVGRATAIRALDRGHVVMVMSRHASQMRLAYHELTKFDGDITSAPAVATAVRLANPDVIVTAISAPVTRGPVAVFSSGMRNVLTAIGPDSRVRVLAVTGVGAGDSRGHGSRGYNWVFQPLLLHTIYEDKDREEQLLSTSSARYTIVRPAEFLPDPPGDPQPAGATAAPLPPYFVATRLDGVTTGRISRAQIAEYLVAAMEGELNVRETVALTR
ncbi:MAG: NAD(P)H-binding protein [Steroidobacteraceae bacterium]